MRQNGSLRLPSSMTRTGFSGLGQFRNQRRTDPDRDPLTIAIREGRAPNPFPGRELDDEADRIATLIENAGYGMAGLGQEGEESNTTESTAFIIDASQSDDPTKFLSDNIAGVPPPDFDNPESVNAYLNDPRTEAAAQNIPGGQAGLDIAKFSAGILSGSRDPSSPNGLFMVEYWPANMDKPVPDIINDFLAYTKGDFGKLNTLLTWMRNRLNDKIRLLSADTPFDQPWKAAGSVAILFVAYVDAMVQMGMLTQAQADVLTAPKSYRDKTWDYLAGIRKYDMALVIDIQRGIVRGLTRDPETAQRAAAVAGGAAPEAILPVSVTAPAVRPVTAGIAGVSFTTAALIATALGAAAWAMSRGKENA